MRDAIDQKLAAALFDVPVPVGLAERVLERVEDAELDADHEKPGLRRSSPFVPTWLLMSGGLLATAASVLVAVWLGMGQGNCLSEQFALDEAIQSVDIEADPSAPLVADKPAPADFPFSASVVPVRGTRWRPLDGSSFAGSRGVVYDLPGPPGTRAALYVIAAEPIEGMGVGPASCPFTTAGCCASAWQENGLLYVLVVRGDLATYRAYLDLPHDPVA